jgi:hypothetical protein
MSENHRALVILRDATAAPFVARSQGRFRVLSQLGMRILVVDIDDDAARGLGTDTDVMGVFEREVPADVRAALSPDERLFVSGWLSRSRGN